MGVAQPPRKYVTCLSPPSGFLCGRVVTPRCRGVKLFSYFYCFFIFLNFGEMHNLFVSALVQYNNTNVRLPEYFFSIKSSVGKELMEST